jgi:hypothetical protein
MAVAALGHSGSSGPEGVTGDIVAFDSVDALRAAPNELVQGKIVFVDHAMPANQDGSGYGQFGAPRRQGPTLASQKGRWRSSFARSGPTTTGRRIPAR